MLTSTFCHIPGIGEKTEQSLWSAGIVTWDSAIQQAPVRLPRSLQESWNRHIQESIDNYAKRNTSYFTDNLQSSQHWRLYRDYQDCCAFIDIETTGLYSGEITTIALYDGCSIRFYVNGQNLGDFARDIQDYLLLVTYNGKLFDLPWIEGYFGIKLPQAHIDLRWPLRSLGLKGGLKSCERQLGIARPGLEDVDGSVAVMLWNDFQQRKNDKALETLLAYNIQDALDLHTLVVHVYNEKVRLTPFSDRYALPSPSLPAVPFKADRVTVERVCNQFSGRMDPWRRLINWVRANS